MDCGKSIALLASNPGTVEEMQETAHASGAPVIAVLQLLALGLKQTALV